MMNRFKKECDGALEGVTFDETMKSTVRARTAGHGRARTWRRTAIVLCAVLAIAVTGAVAGVIGSGKVAYLASSLRWNASWTDFNKTEQYAERNVPGMKYVESFSTGFTFYKGWENWTDKRDEADQTLESYPGIILGYQNEDGVKVSFDVDPVQTDMQYGENPFEETREIDGIPVGYRAMRSITLPSGTKPTEEEQALFDSGEINIGWDAEDTAREESTFYRVSWVQDGNSYAIYTYQPGDLTKDDFFQMAAEVIAA